MTRLTFEAVAEQLSKLLEPVDFDALVRQGVLSKHGTWYEIKDMSRLSESARLKINEIKQSTGAPALVRFGKPKGRKRR